MRPDTPTTGQNIITHPYAGTLGNDELRAFWKSVFLATIALPGETYRSAITMADQAVHDLEARS